MKNLLTTFNKLLGHLEYSIYAASIHNIFMQVRTEVKSLPTFVSVNNGEYGDLEQAFRLEGIDGYNSKAMESEVRLVRIISYLIRFYNGDNDSKIQDAVSDGMTLDAWYADAF